MLWVDILNGKALSGDAKDEPQESARVRHRILSERVTKWEE
jgi:hypothetical protein